ncbi:MAG: hypothetical protein OXU45_03420 [Candidatus Melainabacteria bacterium]|nr:hypothetical protein [Candidatus Melainabacteria bacterium]
MSAISTRSENGLRAAAAVMQAGAYPDGVEQRNDEHQARLEADRRTLERLNETDLSPCLPEISDEPFGNRYISAREFRELARQGRLYTVLAETEKRMGPSRMGSMAVGLIDQLCKMDIGLQGPNRNEILYLAYHTIQGSYINQLMSSRNWSAISEALAQSGKLISLLEKYVTESHDYKKGGDPQHWFCGVNIAMQKMLNASLAKYDGVTDENREFVQKWTPLVLRSGLYEGTDPRAIDSFGRKQALSILIELAKKSRQPRHSGGFDLRYYDVNTERERQGLPTIDQMRDAARDRRLETLREERLKTINPELVAAMNQLRDDPLNLNDDNFRVLFQENNEIGFTALREFARSSNDHALALMVLFIESGYREEASYVFDSMMASGYRPQAQEYLRSRGLDQKLLSVENRSPAEFLQELKEVPGLPITPRICGEKIYGNPELNTNRLLDAGLFDWIEKPTRSKLKAPHYPSFKEMLETRFAEAAEDDKGYWASCLKHLAKL